MRYEITKQYGCRWDWLNVITAQWPYTLRAYEDGQVYPFGRQVGIFSTKKGAKRRIKREKTERWAARGVVYEEQDGAELLPDLRTIEVTER